jgi:hypothetical protein
MPDLAHSLLGLEVPNFLPSEPDFLRPAGRLIWSSLLLVAGTAVAVVMIRRPKRSAEPATWAATITGAMGVWALLILAYGVVPHEWLTFASSYLNWGKDTYVLTEGQFASSVPPFEIPRAVVADTVVTLMYVAFLGVNVWLFAAWQKRKVAEPATEGDGAADEGPLTGGFGRFRRRRARTSAYGRPVTAAD